MKNLKMKYTKSLGFSLIELMVSVLIALFLSAGLITLFVTLSRVYSATSSQANAQNTENIISSILAPQVRNAGFFSCGTLSQTISLLKTPSNYDFLSPFHGFEAKNTQPGKSFTLPLVNSTNTSDWSPSLPDGLKGLVAKGSDVLMFLTLDKAGYGVTYQGDETQPITVAPDFGKYPIGSLAVLSNCTSSVVFQMTSTTQSGPTANVTINHDTSGASPGNKTDAFPSTFNTGSQISTINQIAWFVGVDPVSGDSFLYQATLVNNSWQVAPVVTGVDNMQVMYGIGSNHTLSQYVSADQVTNWNNIISIRIGFLLSGLKGSVNPKSIAPSWSVLGTLIKMPVDTRLRHTFEITLNLRNG